MERREIWGNTAHREMTVNKNNFDVKHNNQNGHKSGETGSETGKGLDSDESLDQFWQSS